jgi:osmotically-inducible protein OsmY
MKRQLTMTMILAAFAATAANAQPADTGPDRMQQEKFRALDKNGDGTLSKGEVSHIKGYAAAFDKADLNRDARLTLDEFVEAEAAYDRQRIASYAGDSALTAKVKSALIQEHDLKSTDVSVESDNGRVILSGFVANEAQRKKALHVTSKVSGVKEVKDALVVK